MLKNNEYSLNIKNNCIHIINYKRIIDINSNIISIYLNKSLIHVKGTNMIISAMDEYEIVINGCIKSIEFINE